MPWNYSVITSCLYCKRERIKPVPPFMFDIPEDRHCVDKKPFTNTGVDYVLRRSISHQTFQENRSNQATAKRYIALFICLTTKAVHREITSDLSTDAFILALRRFIYRRGIVNIIRSDNGTNLVVVSNI